MFRTDEDVKLFLQQTKLVCMTRNGMNKESFSFFQKNHKIFKSDKNEFLESYILYKNHKFTEALSMLKKHESNFIKIKK